ncbi:hypothetical protein NFI96_009619 [Prochilodus magdalenae]|nr:hypothetical protein NFI96_009619 [Prochilodus magdalenae]
MPASRHMRLGIVVHQQEPRTHCTRVGSDNGNTTGGITFFTVSPEPVTSVTCAQVKPALICEKHKAPLADLPILVFCGKCQSSSTVLAMKASDIAELQVQTVRRGDDTTIRCGQKAELKELAWYKERLGKLPQYVVRKAITGANSSPGSKSGIYYRMNPGDNIDRFSVDEEKFDLSIKGVKEEDIGIYLCGNGESRSLKFISGTLLLFAEEKTDHHPPPEPDKHQCSVQTVTLSCSGEHSVYWIRHGSGEPHPGIIYTPRYTSDECESSSETDSSTQSCVYKLPKRNLSLSDAGTYYCAVAACGPETKSTGKGNNWTVVALITSNAVSVIVMLVLGGLLWKKQQKVKTSDITELQVQTVRRGDNTTIRCDQKAELKELAWYKERLGKLPQYVVRKVITGANSSPGSKSGIYHKFNPGVNRSRFSVDEEKFDLSIKGVKEEDIGIYFCGNGESRSLKFISGTLLLFAEEKTDHHPPPEPDKHQCSVQTVTLSCSGEHSVYWIRHGSGEPHPGIIYTPRYTSDECESSSETDSSTQSCVYKLPKRNLSLSDAGTYYCAVAACGPETKSTGKGGIEPRPATCKPNVNWLETRRAARTTLCRGIRKTKRQYSRRIALRFGDSRDTWSLWLGIQAITDFKPRPQSYDSTTSLLSDLNEFFPRFEALHSTPALKSLPPPGDQVVKLSPDSVRGAFSKINAHEAHGPDDILVVC